MKTLTCECTEGFLTTRGADGSVHRERLPGVHDCIYIKWRNGLIPEAERIADRRFKPHSHEWCGAYMNAMETLVAERRHELAPLDRAAHLRRAITDLEAWKKRNHVLGELAAVTTAIDAILSPTPTPPQAA